ncbi:MAG: CapA family protein, partial [Actinobacteria bacterium]|nr:CapA family protein [Actinomycetota bacterium]
MRPSSTYKKILHILIASIVAIMFSTTLTSCSLFKSGLGKTEGADTDPTSETVESGELDTDNGQAVTEDKKEDIAIKIWIENIIPEKISSEIVNFLKGDPSVEIVPLKEQAQAVLEILPAGAITGGSVIYEDLNIYYIMAPVVSFYNISDGTGWEEIRDWWSGDMGALDDVFGGNNSSGMVLADEDYRILEKILGEPVNEKIQSVGESAVQDSLRIIDREIAITSFDHIEKQYKVLSVNGASVFDRGLDYDDYPLAFSVMLTGTDREIVKKAAGSLEGLEITNRDMSRFTSLMMTGVTAMARYKNIGIKMDEIGILYPAEEIADILKSADITHISNEIPFVEGCTSENRFPFMCSDPDYIELLRYVGTDVIELTGNHLNDYGHDWMLYTLKMYEDEGWPYFGGGR